MLLRHSQCRTNLPTIGKLFERALARDEQLGLLGEWSEDIDCVRPLYLAASQQTKRTTKRGIGERWRSGGRTFPLDTSELEAKQTEFYEWEK